MRTIKIEEAHDEGENPFTVMKPGDFAKIVSGAKKDSIIFMDYNNRLTILNDECGDGWSDDYNNRTKINTKVRVLKPGTVLTITI